MGLSSMPWSRAYFHLKRPFHNSAFQNCSPVPGEPQALSQVSGLPKESGCCASSLGGFPGGWVGHRVDRSKQCLARPGLGAPDPTLCAPTAPGTAATVCAPSGQGGNVVCREKQVLESGRSRWPSWPCHLVAVLSQISRDCWEDCLRSCEMRLLIPTSMGNQEWTDKTQRLAYVSTQNILAASTSALAITAATAYLTLGNC